jgi:hypothetical protein
MIGIQGIYITTDAQETCERSLYRMERAINAGSGLTLSLGYSSLALTAGLLTYSLANMGEPKGELCAWVSIPFALSSTVFIPSGHLMRRRAKRMRLQSYSECTDYLVPVPN